MIIIKIFQVIIIPLDEGTLYRLWHAAILINIISNALLKNEFYWWKHNTLLQSKKKQGEEIGFPVVKIWRGRVVLVFCWSDTWETAIQYSYSMITIKILWHTENINSSLRRKYYIKKLISLNLGFSFNHTTFLSRAAWQESFTVDASAPGD